MKSPRLMIRALEFCRCVSIRLGVGIESFVERIGKSGRRSWRPRRRFQTSPDERQKYTSGGQGYSVMSVRKVGQLPQTDGMRSPVSGGMR